ncbi:MAG: aminoglycoside phosphotransferase family protein [Dehalococcoidia bacterium]|nr:aminoglycoside phosphotransferase family protein [Dehalococcoidia bacterium]
MNESTEQSLPTDVAVAIADALPGADPARATIAGVGWDVVAWRLPASDGDWLARVPRHEGAPRAIEDQTCLMRALAPLGFPVPPEPRLVRDVRGRVVAGLYRYVHGRTAEVRGAHERERLARGLAAFVSRLHAVDLDRLEGCRVRRYEPWRDEFAPMVERVLPHLAPRTASWLRARAELLAELSDRLPPPVLVHADLKPKHVLLRTDGEIAGVLDFESIPVTDPAFEFSRIWQNWDRALAERVLAHYDRHADRELMQRAEAYLDFDVVAVLDSALKREDMAHWTPRAKRMLAARAAWSVRRQAGKRP